MAFEEQCALVRRWHGGVGHRRAGGSRREFLKAVGMAGALGLTGRQTWPDLMLGQGASGVHFSVAAFDRERILRLAEGALTEKAVSLVEVRAPGVSDGGRAAAGGNAALPAAPQPGGTLSGAHRFYSEKAAKTEEAGGAAAAEGGPFLGHVDLLTRMNARVSALTAAWRLTGEARYFEAAVKQVRVWTLDPATRMEPTLESAGVVRGAEDDARNNGLTETVCLAETARAAAFLCAAGNVAGKMSEEEAAGVRGWFAALLTWFTESKKAGIAREAKDAQAICWTMQAAEFARLTRNDAVLRECAHLFKERLLRQMNFDGAFPLALKGDRPYAASMFTLECLGAAAESLSTPYDSLWKFNLPDGRGMHSAVAWAVPFLTDRGKWPFLADARWFKEQPLRENAVLFAGRAYDRPEYVEVWKKLKAESAVGEVAREHPLTQPALWAVRPPV